MKINSKIILVCRILVGITFIFSGFVKAVDPMGSQIKIEEYLMAFKMDWLGSLALIMGILLCSIEFILGIGLLFGSKIRLISLLTLIVMSFFTIQTFILALWNPVQDCGCFGDAIKLTNWQTFYKNIFLMILVLIVYFSRKKISPMFQKFGEWRIISIAILFILFIAVHSYRYLPLIDFLPYKVGNDIGKLMVIPPGAPRDEYKTVLIYKNKKTNKTVNFNMDNIPSDKEWEWAETKNILIKKGYRPPIHDFTITASSGEDFTQKFLDEDGYRILIVQEQLKNSNPKAQEKLNDLVDALNEHKEVKVWALTSSLWDDLDQYIKQNKVRYTFYSTDQTTLKTIIRSNPGVLLLKNNLVIKKWPARCIPDADKLLKYLYR
jgi:uncharacterized membrane protein YphA (DoxX/SURF4 family)